MTVKSKTTQIEKTLLNFAKGLPELPISAVTQTFSFLGKRGGGKSYAATKLCELMLTESAQVVALDPVGVWWGLRVAGAGNGFDLPVFGGMHGDLPLAPQAGKLIARLIVERRLSAIIDVSGFISSEQTRFVYDFLTEFFELKKSCPSAVHLFLEECQEFVPQNIVKGDTFSGKMLHAGERLVKLGRNFGIGCSLISQRPQEVNKKVLNQTEVLLAFQMTGLQERKTVADWVADKGENIDRALLPKLGVGEAYFWSPSWLKIAGVFKINKKRTADVSKTPQVGDEEQSIEPEKLTPVDVENLRQEMESLSGNSEGKRAKAPAAPAPASVDDKKLREREQQLIERERSLIERERIVDNFSQQLSERIENIFGEVNQFIDERLKAIQTELREGLKMPAIVISDSSGNGRHLVSSYGKAPVNINNSRVIKRSAPAPGKQSSANASLSSGELAILIAVAQYSQDGAARDQISILTGYKRSTRDAYIQRLRQHGFVEIENSLLVITDDGFNALPEDYEPLPTGAELRQYWLDRLSQGESTIFRHTIDAYPNAIDRETLTELTDYKRSTRDAYIQRLITRKLIATEGRGFVKASNNLFD